MDNIQSTTTWGTASQSLNTNFTSIQSALDAINSSLGTKAANTLVSDLATQVSALQSVVTSTAADPDSVINTIQEVLSAFSQFPEGTTVAAALSGKANLVLSPNVQTGTAYTLALSDNGQWVQLNNAASITLTIPLNTAVPFPVGSQIIISQEGTGQVTFTPASGVTMQQRQLLNKTAGQFAVSTLLKKATDTWVLTGDITA